MKIQLLPSSIDTSDGASVRQHLTCIVVDDRVALDAGSLAMSCTDLQRQNIRDIVLSHVHLDHIAGLPLFIDDLFASLTTPILIHATEEMITALEDFIFNWTIYPRFAELSNSFGKVMDYRPFTIGETVDVAHLNIRPIEVNHNFPSVGMVVSDGNGSIGLTGDTAPTDDIWDELNRTKDIAAVFVECAFPNEMSELARVSNHLTPRQLSAEIKKLKKRNVPVFVVNIKPMYRTAVIEQIEALDLPNVNILQIGRIYEF